MLKYFYAALLFFCMQLMASGQEIKWAESISASEPRYSDLNGLIIDGDFIYRAGHSGGTTTINTPSGPVALERGYFLTKTDLEGNHIWSKSMTTERDRSTPWNSRLLLDDISSHLSIGDQGRIYLATTMNWDLSIATVSGDLRLQGNDFAPMNQEGAMFPFLAVFDADGDILSARMLASAGDINRTRTDIAVYDMERFGSDFYVVYKYEYEAILQPGRTDETRVELPNDVGGDGLILAKYDNDFNLLWHRNFGQGTTNRQNEASNAHLAISDQGITLLTTFAGETTLQLDNADPVVIGTAPDGAAGAFAGILAQFTLDGEYRAHKTILSNPSNDRGNFFNALELDGENNIYIAGTSVAGGGQLGEGDNTYNFFNTSEWKPFVARYSPDLEFEWARSFIAFSSGGQLSTSFGASMRYMECDNNGSCLVAGETGQRDRLVDFDEGSDVFTTNESRISSLFLLRFEPDGTLTDQVVMESAVRLPLTLTIPDHASIDELQIIDFEHVFVTGLYTYDLAVGAGLDSQIDLSLNVPQDSPLDYDMFMVALSMESEDDDGGGDDDDDPVTSIEDERLAEQVVLGPNPVNHELWVKLPNTAQAWRSYRVLGAHGQVVKEQPVSANELHIPMSHLNDGFYVLEISNEQTYVKKKFLKLSR